jgi:uncharacterized protein (DUF736 family)
VIKQTDRCYKGHICTVSIKADIDILPNSQKTADSQPCFRVMTDGVAPSASWTPKAKHPTKNMLTYLLPLPESGLPKLYANLGKAAGSEDKDLYAVIWSPVD